MESYLVAIGVSAGIYALVTLGLNVIWSTAGMVNLGLVGFFAVSANASALVNVKLGMPIPVGMAAATLTGGSDGISGIPGPFRADLSPAEFNLLFQGLTVAIVTVVFGLFERLSYSPFGRVLRAIRRDDLVVAVSCKWAIVFKVKAFAIGCAALGLAGALYGRYTSFIAPDIFVPLLTLYIRLSLLVGGVGNNKGAVVGAVLVVVFLESTRFTVPLTPGIDAVQAAAVREILVSGVRLLLLRIHTRGLAPEARSHLPEQLRWVWGTARKAGHA